jgi:hypothetical protein
MLSGEGLDSRKQVESPLLCGHHSLSYVVRVHHGQVRQRIRQGSAVVVLEAFIEEQLLKVVSWRLRSNHDRVIALEQLRDSYKELLAETKVTVADQAA